MARHLPRVNLKHGPSSMLDTGLPRSFMMPAMLVFGTTVVLSVFLLLLIQSILAKEILPWFEGSLTVCTTCLVFSETVLLAGYARDPRAPIWTDRFSSLFEVMEL